MEGLNKKQEAKEFIKKYGFIISKWHENEGSPKNFNEIRYRSPFVYNSEKEAEIEGNNEIVENDNFENSYKDCAVFVEDAKKYFNELEQQINEFGEKYINGNELSSRQEGETTGQYIFYDSYEEAKKEQKYKDVKIEKFVECAKRIQENLLEK